MAKDGFVTTPDGVRIAYRDHGGRGRGLVLLHGIGGNLETMDQYADALGQGRRPVAIDLRCCGQSGDGDATFDILAADVAAVVSALGLGDVDVVGHSLGGMVAGFYAASHPSSRIVSIDGFPPGSLTVAGREDRAAYRRWLARARGQLYALTEQPQSGDISWRDAQRVQLVTWMRAIGYTAPNAEAVALRQFVRRADGTFDRHPPRELVDALFADAPLDVLRAYRASKAETLIIRCTGWAPAAIDFDLADLANTRDNVEVVRLAVSHLAPAWDALYEISQLVHDRWRNAQVNTRPDSSEMAASGSKQLDETWSASCR